MLAAFVSAVPLWLRWALPAHRQIHLVQTGNTVGDLVGVALVVLLLSVLALGGGWSARARTQVIIWAAVAFSSYFHGLVGALLTIAFLCGVLALICAKQRSPLKAPVREQPVDLAGYAQRAQLLAFLRVHDFLPFCQLSSTFDTGSIAEEIWQRSDGLLCRLTGAHASSTTAYTVYMESWFADGRSVRSSDQLRWEATNDAERHPLHQRIVPDHAALYAHHRSHLSRTEPLLRVGNVDEYIALRRRQYDDSQRSSVLRGLSRLRNGEYRLTVKATAMLIWRFFNLPGALATEGRF